MLKQYFLLGCGRLCKCILTAPTFFRAAVMDMARIDWGLDTGRAGALGAGSGREGLGWGGRGLVEVDDTATATAAATAAAGATFPAAMPTFTPRAASYHNTQHQRSSINSGSHGFF